MFWDKKISILKGIASMSFSQLQEFYFVIILYKL